MDAKELTRLPDPRENVRGELREVIKDLRGKRQLYIRLRLTGWHFPHRAAEPFAVIGNVVSQRVIISRDGLSADAYFDRRVPPAQRVSFGYGKIIAWDFDIPIQPTQIEFLDRTKLPAGTFDPFEIA